MTLEEGSTPPSEEISYVGARRVRDLRRAVIAVIQRAFKGRDVDVHELGLIVRVHAPDASVRIHGSRTRANADGHRLVTRGDVGDAIPVFALPSRRAHGKSTNALKLIGTC